MGAGNRRCLKVPIFADTVCGLRDVAGDVLSLGGTQEVTA